MNAMRLKDIRKKALSAESYQRLKQEEQFQVWDLDYYSTSDEEDDDSEESAADDSDEVDSEVDNEEEK